jgi:SAM-dependent methyltransferase
MIRIKKKAGYEIKEREHFDRLAETTGDTWWGNKTPAGIKRLQRRASVVTDRLGRLRDPVILELGCGAGTFSQYVLGLSPARHLIGCDSSPKAVQIAADRCATYDNARFEVADATLLPHPAQTFDAVVGTSILHHLPLEIALQECFRVLKPNGVIWFSEPNMMNPQVAIQKNVGFIKRILDDTEDETAFFRWPLAMTLRKIGFQNVSVQPHDFLHPTIPRLLISFVDRLGRGVEKIPLLREIAGSLWISAWKPNSASDRKT